MALIDISCIFSEFTTTGEFPDSFLITPFVTIAQLEFKKLKTFTIKKKFLLSRFFLSLETSQILCFYNLSL